MADESSTVANESASTPAPAAVRPQAELPQPRPTYRGTRRPHIRRRAESRKSLLDVVRKAAPRRERSLVPATNGASQGQESRQLRARSRKTIQDR